MKYFFVFCKEDLLLEKTAEGYTIPLLEETPTEVTESEPEKPAEDDYSRYMPTIKEE